MADYVACVRAQGAKLGAVKSAKFSADAEAFAVKVSGAAELQENLAKEYAVSDEATLEIIRTCNSISRYTEPPPKAVVVPGSTGAPDDD